MADNVPLENTMTIDPAYYINMLRISNRLVRPAIEQAIAAVGLKEGDRILDLPCGLGSHSLWMTEQTPGLSILAGDIMPAHLDDARANVGAMVRQGTISFEERNMFDIADPDNHYDLVWCCDGLWIGDRTHQAVAEEPYGILNEFKRVARPGGTIALLFWTGQKLLPGHPLVETALNATEFTNRPITSLTDRESHNMCAGHWLHEIGCKDITCRTYVANITGPFNEKEQLEMVQLANMLWSGAAGQVQSDIRHQYEQLMDHESKAFIFNQDVYTGFITYTLFTGIKV